MAGNEDYEHAKSLASYVFNDIVEKHDLQTAMSVFMEVANVNELIEDIQ